jgi:hypothetical protein
MTPIFVHAADIIEGDIVCFGNPKSEVTIERLSVAQCDGAIGMHGNDDTWHAWYPPTDRIRVKLARHTLHGRSFTVLARFPNNDEGVMLANVYMVAHDGAAVLEVTDAHIILADKTDKGIPSTQPN